MMRDAKLHRIGGRTSSPRRTGLILSALLALVALATACAGGSSGPGVAGQGAASSPSASPSGDLRDAQLAYAQCMRDHGISEFPDPEPGGGIAVVGEPGGDLDPDSPRFQAADDACKSLLPPMPAEDEQEGRDEMLAYAQCMREHGFPSFPDPKPGEGIDLDAGEHPELDPSNPRFQQANEACGGPAEGDTNTQTNGGAP
jgi:hypothetical protein